MESRFASTCVETGKKICKGESILYVPNKGAYCEQSNAYQEFMGIDRNTLNMIEANENAYFDNFARGL
jgi:nitrous oxide reductase